MYIQTNLVQNICSSIIYNVTSLMAQTVMNLPATQETQVYNDQRVGTNQTFINRLMDNETHINNDTLNSHKGFPDSSVCKDSACNPGYPGSIPGSGRSTNEGIGYPLQYSWASFVAQLVKNPLTMQETWVQSLGWEDPLEKGKATHSSILA